MPLVRPTGKMHTLRARYKSLPRWIRWPVKLGAICCVLGLVTALTLFVIYGQIAKSFDLDDLGKMPQRSVVYDVRGKILGTLHGENRTVVPLGKISPHFVDALLAREDARFHEHGGVDWIGALRAALRNVKDRRIVQGASTITMQLARNSFGMTERTLHRKLVEVMLARRIEAEFSKDEILELYINRIFFGSGIYGLELASQTYFGKPAETLTLAESAMVAGIIRSPNRFSPTRNFEGACKERDDVLARMVETGFLTQAEADTARAQKIAVLEERDPTIQDDYALDVVRRDLDLVLAEDNVEDGGLIIYTTVDTDLQRAAEKALESRLAEIESSPGYFHPRRNPQDHTANSDGTTDYLQGALVVIDNRTGGIAATVGGRDPQAGRLNRAIHSPHPVGDAIAPFIYATAYVRGTLPGTHIETSQRNHIETDETNGPNGPNGPPIPVERGLVQNIPNITTKIGESTGLEITAEIAVTAGLDIPENPGQNILAGSFGATVKNLASAYTIFPNNGQRRRPYIIDRIEDTAGNLIYRSGVISYPVVSPAASSLTDRALRMTVEPGNPAADVQNLEFKVPAAAFVASPGQEVGAWFLGYTDRLTCGVWIGFDRSPPVGIPGSPTTQSLPIWVDVMKRAQQFGYQPIEPTARPATREVGLCRISGRLSTSGCTRHGQGYKDDLPEDIIPKSKCHLHDGPTQR